MSSINFKTIKDSKGRKVVLESISGPFSLIPDFTWDDLGLKDQVKAGWELTSVNCDKEIISALLTKDEGNTLFTKNTSLKLEYQGNAYSHMIKEYYEKIANERGLSKIQNICLGDDFRTIGLNESHGYKQVQTLEVGGKRLLVWEKNLK